MADRCKNCGAELFTGARFCRFCGRQTGRLPDEDLPTQIMQDPGTAQVGSGTTPVYAPPTTFAPGQFPPVPGQSRSRLGWVITFIAIALFGAMFLGLLFVARSFRREAAPQAPRRAEVASGETVLGAGDAEVSSGEMIINRRFEVDPTGIFSLKNINGDVTIECWDNAGAEVRIITRGGRERDRRAARVVYSRTGGKLEVRTVPSRGPVEVNYEVKLPRALRRLEIESVQSALQVTGFAGALAAKIHNGSIELEDMPGSASTEITNGETKAEFEKVTPGERMAFQSVNGDIEVSFKTLVDLDVNAETTFGQISAHEEFKLDSISQNFVGRRARGKVGAGGQPLEIKTVRGDIRLVR